MSFTIDASNLKIWNNAAFTDILAADDPAGAKPWLPLQPISTNLLHLPNLSPHKQKSSKKPAKHDTPSIPNDGNVDADIEEVEKEIRKLSLKLEALRIKKAEIGLRASAARRGRIIPAKFMEPKPSPASEKMEESPARVGRRGFSLGPLEIHGSAVKPCFRKLEGIKEENTPQNPQLSGARTRKSWLQEDSSKPCFRQRGVSLGPSEIAFRSRFRLPSKLEEITKKEKGQSLSVSPRSRKPMISTVSELRRGIATVGAKKPVKTEDSVIRSVKTKNLFQEKQKPVSCRKHLTKATARTVASRYSLSNARIEELPEKKKKQRKLSLPGPANSSLSLGSLGESSNGEPLLSESSPPSIVKIITTMLPKIRTVRNIDESPRDSGCALKRAAQLAGKKSHFSMEQGQDSIVDFPCNFLEFEEH